MIRCFYHKAETVPFLKLPLPEGQTSETWELSGSTGEKGAFNFFLSSKGKNVFEKSRILNVESRMKRK
jgi:hypothetical protein